MEVSILFEVDSTSGAPDTAMPIKACGAYDKDSHLLHRLTGLQNLIPTDLKKRLEDLEAIEPSTLKCLPTLAQAMTTAGVTDLGSCPAGEQCQNQSVNYQLASGNRCTPASKSICASCVNSVISPPPGPSPGCPPGDGCTPGATRVGSLCHSPGVPGGCRYRYKFVCKNINVGGPCPRTAWWGNGAECC